MELKKIRIVHKRTGQVRMVPKHFTEKSRFHRDWYVEDVQGHVQKLEQEIADKKAKIEEVQNEGADKVLDELKQEKEEAAKVKANELSDVQEIKVGVDVKEEEIQPKAGEKEEIDMEVLEKFGETKGYNDITAKELIAILDKNEVEYTKKDKPYLYNLYKIIIDA